jgi:hypothetical protein
VLEERDEGTRRRLLADLERQRLRAFGNQNEARTVRRDAWHGLHDTAARPVKESSRLERDLATLANEYRALGPPADASDRVHLLLTAPVWHCGQHHMRAESPVGHSVVYASLRRVLDKQSHMR